jgi:integrase/recombinase XerD
MYQYRREPLNEDEEQRLRGSCRKAIEIVTVCTLLETGLRVSEFQELELDQVDWQGRRLVVHGKGGDHGHNSKRRVVPLSDDAFACLSRYQYLLEQLPTVRTLERIVLRCANRAHITKKVSPHVCRHTFAVRCLERGIHPLRLQRLLGHESFETTQIYLNFCSEDVVREFHRKWDRRNNRSLDWFD